MVDRSLGSILVERFPALSKLTLTRRRNRIPYIQQTALTDCAAACLAMVLGYHGRHVRLSEVRDIVGCSRDGTHALNLLKTARLLNLRGRGVQLDDWSSLRLLETGAILHWRFNHFVVFERVERRGAWIMDPAVGRRWVSHQDLDKGLTGVALIFEPDEDFETGTSEKPTLWRYVRQLGTESGLLTKIVVTSILLQIFALSIPLLTGLLVDRVVPRGDLDLLRVLAIGFSGLVGFRLLSGLIRSFLLLHLRTRLDARMSLDFLDHMVDLPYLFFQRRSAGDLMMRLQSNSTIREILTSSALSGVLDGAMVGLYLILLWVANLKIGILVTILGAINVGLFLVTRGRQRDLMSQSLQAQADSRSYQVQLLAGIETLKVSGAESRAVEHWSNLFVKELNVSLDRGRLDAVVNSVVESLRMGSPLIILMFGGLLVLRGELSLGMMLALNALAIGFLTPLSTLVTTALQLQLMSSYLDRISDVLETPREQEGRSAQVLKSLQGRITLENISFSYSPLVKPAVREVSCEIEPGALVAVVGASGSGKSTLAALLAGLYMPDQGRVLYDGVNIAELDLKWLRSRLGFVAQQPFVFGTSIRANIALSDPSLPFSTVVEAAQRAAIHRDVTNMPMGYDTIVADGGASLSGGQKQRLALARALVQRPKILILDEATSALDSITELEIQHNLSTLRCTRVLIAHRLSTVREADMILVMDRGQIVERGTHEELLERSGTYRELVSAQLEKQPDLALSA